MADQLAQLSDVKAYLKITDAVSDALLTRLISAASAYFLTQCSRQSILQNTYTDVRHGGNAPKIILLNYPVLSVASVTVYDCVIPQSPDGIQFGWWFDQYGVGLTCGRRFNRGWGNVTIVYTAGEANAQVTNELRTLPATGYEETGALVLQALQAPWVADNGVNYASNGNPLTPVGHLPQSSGQYFAAGGGVYYFALGDSESQVLLNYTIAGVPADVEQVVIELCALKYKSRNNIGLSSAREGDTLVYSYTRNDLSDFAKDTIKKYERKTLLPA